MLPFSVALRAGNRAADAWSPAQLGASLLGWWTADRSDLITLQTGSKVSSWRDVVAGYDLTQGTDDSRPVYSATGFNGLPGITADGIDDNLARSSSPFPSAAAQCEIWALGDWPSIASNNANAFSYGGSSVAAVRAIRMTTVSSIMRLIGDATSANVNTNFAFPGGRHIIRFAVDGVESRLDYDGGQRSTLTVTPTTSTLRMRMFAGSNTGVDRLMAATIADVLVTDLLTDAQAAQLQAYLLTKRG